MSRVDIKDLNKSFGPKRVLQEVTLSVAQGEFCVVVGPSGCGKSTLLRIVAGLEQASSGHVLFDGQVVDQKQPYQRNVGMVFQNYALYPHMTVFENLAFALRAHRTQATEISRRISQVAEMLELTPLLRAVPSTLSGGQRQRVALGRALVRQPQVFLMDEPLSNLDAVLRERTRLELRHLHDQVGIPTIYVTHDQTEAMTMADRVAVMQEGSLVQVGSPDEVYSQPASVFVARLFGSPPMNVVPALATRGHDGWLIHLEGAPDLPITLPAWADDMVGRAVDDGGKMWIGFRAESLNEGEVPQGLPVTVIVDLVESLGVRCHVHGHWNGHPLTSVTPSRSGRTRGTMMRLMVPWEAVHWFHGSTGERVSSPLQPVASNAAL